LAAHIITVYKLDRIGRSTARVASIAEGLTYRGIHIRRTSDGAADADQKDDAPDARDLR
jgi:DNA invertase Pin-like site-specific DNA recombinase